MKKSFQVIIIILLSSVAYTSTSAQLVIPNGYFASPLKISLAITGSFGEIRPNHFHSGIDFQIHQQEGLPVYAVADGVVSRIKVSPVGFGNALYIDHPNGFTSVYGHLKGYNDTIANYVLDNQYKQKSFDVDLFPLTKKEFIYVRKGQLIGYAGNSGASGGPHLHFELRDTKTERTINPILFGFPITDRLSPVIDFIQIYPENISSFYGASNEVSRLSVKKAGAGEYRLAAKDTLLLWGSFSFGVQAFDYNQSAGDRNGWYSVKMFADNEQFFSLSCDSFAFAESRFVNASIDYAANYNLGNRIVISKKLPGNQLSLFKTNASNGVIPCSDNKIHAILIQVADLSGNIAYLRFWIRSFEPQGVRPSALLPSKDTNRIFNYNKVNKFENKEIKIEIPAGSLYENIGFLYHKAAGTKGLFSDIHTLHTPTVPLQNKIKVSVKADRLPASLRNKALLVRINREGKHSSAGGKFEDGYVTTTTNLFDSYAITIDTVPPVIRPSPLNTKSKTALKFTVSDDFSGIASYRGELDGKWVLVEWDPKNRLMQYKFDKMTHSGKNIFKLLLQDEKGNASSYSTSFVM